MNPKWDSYLSDVLVPRIAKEMNIKTPFKVSLYKLLLYKSGSFFKPHRDTEKEERMFATLVVQLPSRFNGGQLVIEHGNKTKRIDFSSSVECGNEFATFFSTFYCDCKHEILPVSDGIRVCLVYNLVMNGTDGTSAMVPAAPIQCDFKDQFASICEDWRKANSPNKVVYGLSHKYTEKSIFFQSLKSTDQTVADVLVKFSKDYSLAGKCICLRILTKQQYIKLDFFSFYSQFSWVRLKTRGNAIITEKILMMMSGEFGSTIISSIYN